MSRQKPSIQLWSILILILAFALRLYRLDGRALWFDEGVSLTYGHMPLSDLLYYNKLWADTNPPAYRVLLGLWQLPVGITAFTARYLSVWMGVLGVAMTGQIGRRLGLKRSVIRVTMLLMALSPMQVYFSREAKGYAFIQFFILVVIAVWFRLFPRIDTVNLNQQRSWLHDVFVGFVLALAIGLAIGSHYPVAIVLSTINLWVLGWVIIARRRGVSWERILQPALIWFGAHLLAGLAWLPWVLPSFSQALTGAINLSIAPEESVLPLPDYVGSLFTNFASGPTGTLWARIALAVLVFGLAGGGIYALADSEAKTPGRRSLRSTAVLASWLIIPAVMGFFFQLKIAFFWPRFLLHVTPALFLLAAVGLVGLVHGSGILPPIAAPRFAPLARGVDTTSVVVEGTKKGWRTWAAAGFAVVLLGTSSLLIIDQYRLPNPVPDLRPLADDLARQMEPGDALVYSYSWQPGMLLAYLPPDKQPVTYPSFFDDTEAELQQIMERHGRTWLLTFEIGAENPINDVGLWLLANSASPGPVWYETSQLSLFVAPDQVDNPGDPDTCVTFDGARIELCFDPLPDPTVIESPDKHPLALTLTWTANEPLPERFVVFVHVLAPGNPVPVAQQDIQPVNGQRPSYDWVPGQPVLDLHAISLPPDLHSSDETFAVYVGLYDADTAERLPVDDGGDSVLIGQFRIGD